jgi:ABC-2 type transport system ATP-binding protein
MEPVVSPRLIADAVTKRFGSTVAVDGIDLDVCGGVTGVLGPNGSGKSTLLQMLASVLRPDHGSIDVDGRDPATSADRVEYRRRLGYLPQDPGLYQNFTAFDLVDYVAVLKEWTRTGERRDEVRRVLALVGLTDAMHRRIRTLSGGMRQRVALAGALIGSPPFLVLDEPSNGLDPDQRIALRSILSDAGRHGTVIVSTHQTTEVAAFCQRVIVLLAGRVRFIGTPVELAALAEGRVWFDDHPHDAALQWWTDSTGRIRCVGAPPAGAELTQPTIDDGYLLLTNEVART